MKIYDKTYFYCITFFHDIKMYFHPIKTNLRVFNKIYFHYITFFLWYQNNIFITYFFYSSKILLIIWIFHLNTFLVSISGLPFVMTKVRILFLIWELNSSTRIWILNNFHDGDPYDIESSPLRADQWNGFYMIETSIMKELNTEHLTKLW